MRAITRSPRRFAFILGTVLVVGFAGSGIVQAAGGAQVANPAVRSSAGRPSQNDR